MNKDEKIKFIVKLCDNLKISLINNIDIMPESWDDMEIRQLFQDNAKKFNPFKMTRTRMWNYKECVEKMRM